MTPKKSAGKPKAAIKALKPRKVSADAAKLVKGGLPRRSAGATETNTMTHDGDMASIDE